MAQWFGSVTATTGQRIIVQSKVSCLSNPVVTITVTTPSIVDAVSWDGENFHTEVSDPDDAILGYSAASGGSSEYSYTLTYAATYDGPSDVSVTLDQEGDILGATVSVVEG